MGEGVGSDGRRARRSERGGTKPVDKATPVIAKYTAAGRQFDVVTFSFAKDTAAGKRQFMTVKLTEGFGRDWSIGGEKEPSSVERVSLSPKQIEVSYRAVDAQGGLSGEVKFGWNLATTEVS